MLHQINYGESSVVTKIYTELFGLQSYIINGVRSKKARIKSNILQPLSVLDMDVYNRDNRDLQRVKDAHSVNPNSAFGTDVVKGSLAFFIAEVIYRSIQEEEPNQRLFNFLFNFIQALEQEQGSVSNYHLIFMLELSMHLGFYPAPAPNGEDSYFDKREGVFCEGVPHHGDWMDTDSSALLRKIMSCGVENVSEMDMNTDQRNDLVQHLIAYYNLHLPTKFEIRSHKILQTIMH
ncbi:MAG: DNA repair protein RecO [Flavobacteriales bacterium]|nr:DNA repair protein RecO [Flavobacteriales bacterium]